MRTSPVILRVQTHRHPQSPDPQTHSYPRTPEGPSVMCLNTDQKTVLEKHLKQSDPRPLKGAEILHHSY